MKRQTIDEVAMEMAELFHKQSRAEAMNIAKDPLNSDAIVKGLSIVIANRIRKEIEVQRTAETKILAVTIERQGKIIEDLKRRAADGEFALNRLKAIQLNAINAAKKQNSQEKVIRKIRHHADEMPPRTA